jgi:type IV fimbrial biogenesis protein FimT
MMLFCCPATGSPFVPGGGIFAGAAASRLLFLSSATVSGGAPDENLRQVSDMKLMRNKRGITLIELMTCVTIIGIVTMMAIPQFGSTINRLKFRTSARNILSKMRLARSTAITNKQQVGVAFDGDVRTLTIFVDTQNPSGFQFETGDSVLSVDTLPNDFAYIYPEFGANAVVYLPNGSASATGLVQFVAYNGGEYVNYGTVDVLASTGRTKLGELYFY